MGSAAAITILIKAKDEASKILGNTQTRMQKMGKGFKIAGGLVAGAGLAIAGMSIKAAVDMGKLYTKMQAGTGATGKAWEDLKKSFKRVAGSVALDTGTVADVLTELNTRLSLTGEPLEEMGEKIAEVSRMMGVDATTATIELTQAMKRWQVPAEEAPILLDKLFTASQDTGIGIDKLSSLMGEYGSVLINAGWPMEDAIGLFASMEREGLNVSRIMPGLNMAFRKWAEEGVTDLKGALDDAIISIRDASTDSEALAEATGIFGAEGAQRLTDAIRSGDDNLIDGLTELSDKLKDEAIGAVDDFAESTDDAANKMDTAKNKINLAASALGDALLPAITNIVDKMSPMIDSLSTWIGNNKELAAGLIKAAILIGGLMLFAGPLLSFFKVAGKLVHGLVWVFRILVPVIAGVGATLGILIALILAFIATIGFLIYIIVRMRDQIANAFKVAWHAFQDFFLGIGRGIKDAANFIWEKMLWIKDKIIETWNKVIDFFKGIPGKVSDMFRDMVASSKRWLNKMLGYIRDFSWHFSGWTVAGITIIPSFTFEPFKWIPELYKGAIVTKPTLAMIGERGPEAVVPLGRGMQPTTINVYNYFSDIVIREEADLDRLAVLFEQRLRLVLRGA